ncbi:hypothetical protein [Marinomonas pollencensis]|nr:hypothetical protein [Marinomonas pollencensis]
MMSLGVLGEGEQVRQPLHGDKSWWFAASIEVGLWTRCLTKNASF